MSRNKSVLLILIAVIVYLLLPNTPTGIYGKTIILRIAAFTLFFMLIYSVITLNILKKALNRLIENITDENVSSAVNLLRITFDVKRMFGSETLKSIYNQVNHSKNITSKSKQDMYEAIRRKKIDIPLPAKGK
ncbi:hypothetical protein [Anaerovorax odorimutans]|uniref:hypothetical protein n=1 Tax=Anaerovorax odorimutans TaxID=109327 RepID=UPI000404350E|nr:hypothetical protein [Anaerovorax odorimutans]